MSLDQLLKDVSVFEPGTWDNELSDRSLKNWYAVANTKGIIAYFLVESDAFRFRLDYINNILNGGTS